MARYFFRWRDGRRFGDSEEGQEFETIEQAKAAANRALGEWARDILPAGLQRQLAIEVHDEARKPLFCARLIFDVEEVGHQRTLTAGDLG